MIYENLVQLINNVMCHEIFNGSLWKLKLIVLIEIKLTFTRKKLENNNERSNEQYYASFSSSYLASRQYNK